MKKVCIVTGSRAEWGLLKRLAGIIDRSPDMHLQIIATNMHLSPEFGLTYREIESDGFTIDHKVEMLVSGDSANATVKSIGLSTIGFADAYTALAPDMIVVLGDRYELLAAVSAALIYKIAVAHIHGGEITIGAYDDAVRHAVSKMSHLHFTSTQEHHQRVIQMGEQPDTVFNVGSLGVDNIRNTELMTRDDLQRSIAGFTLDRHTIMVTFHPVTMENGTAAAQMRELLRALDSMPEIRVIFTMPNSDTDGRVIMELMERWCDENSHRACWFSSLGSKRYLSALQYIGAVVGNSSSGLIEVPTFGIPTLNIGDRQKGRIRASSVVDCKAQTKDILAKLPPLLGHEPTTVDNPYEKPDSAQNIAHIISSIDPKEIVQKHFYDIKR